MNLRVRAVEENALLAERVGNKYPKRAPAVAWRQIGDEVVILHLKSAVYYSAGEVAARIWELCNGIYSVDSIALQVTAEYEVDHEQALADTSEYVQELARQGLVVIYDRPQED